MSALAVGVGAGEDVGTGVEEAGTALLLGVEEALELLNAHPRLIRAQQKQ